MTISTENRFLSTQAKTIIGSAVFMICLLIWSYVAPAAGSGSLLLLAILGQVLLLDSIYKARMIAVGATVMIVTMSAWWFHRELPDSLWVLFLFTVCTIATLSALSTSLSTRQSKTNE